jgi:hypothetical protein
MERERKRLCNWEECAAKQALLIIVGQYLTPYEALPLRRTFRALNELLKSRQYWLDALVELYPRSYSKSLVRSAMLAMFDCLQLTEDNYHHLFLWDIFLSRKIMQRYNMGYTEGTLEIDPKSGLLLSWFDCSDPLSLSSFWNAVRPDIRRLELCNITEAALLYCFKLAIITKWHYPSAIVNCTMLFAVCCEEHFLMTGSAKQAFQSEESWFEEKLAIMRETVKSSPELQYKKCS